MSPAASWALLVLAFLVTVIGVVFLTRLDRVLDDALARRRARRAFPEQYRYARARDAVARAQNPTVRIGHKTNGSPKND